MKIEKKTVSFRYSTGFLRPFCTIEIYVPGMSMTLAMPDFEPAAIVTLIVVKVVMFSLVEIPPYSSIANLGSLVVKM